jgi:chromosome segregation protein
VHFLRLRLTGFKSFVDPTEFRIEPGLTGVVGPNGCGKSNLLEALRWVMGANSAKALRAEGMDDVIFGGTGTRPPRNFAEVQLTIDNTDRRAPAQFNGHDTLEVARRIDRGSGSTYKVNGVETRARDVQLLFADASTGANSPSLVRQGQISELIAAKPSNRRRILEEAAGVSGLHTRRHEADLRLKAAEANLARLDDVTRELESTLSRLKREARQAETYKKVSAELRALQGAALYARWLDAQRTRQTAQAELHAVEAAVAEATREAAAASAAALDASEALKPLREEETVAAAVLQRMAIEKDRIEREAAQAEAEVARLEADLERIAADHGREGHILGDAAAELARLQADLTELEAAIAAAPERTPELEAAVTAAQAARDAADAEVERLAGEAAAEAARRRAAADKVEQALARARAVAARLQDANARVARADRALQSARTDRAALAAQASPEAVAAKAVFEAALGKLADARCALESAEATRSEALAAEVTARDAARRCEDELRRLRAEAQGLVSLTQGAKKSAYPPALDTVQPDRGYEAALAAALGDDLDAALDVRAPAYWGGAEAKAQSWPVGAAPLAPLVKAPPALAARLALTALVDRGDGDRLQKGLPPGARLVSREGDLWRWDGFVARSEAPKPAAQRLAQRARLTDLEAEITQRTPAGEAAAKVHAEASARVRTAEAALIAARQGPQTAERAVGLAREQVERFGREAAAREARVQSLDETIARFEAELTEAKSALAPAEAEAAQAQSALEAAEADAPEGAVPEVSPELAGARAASAAAREGENRARFALEGERRDRETRARRREAMLKEQKEWARRTGQAEARRKELEKERAKTERALEAARQAPLSIGERRERLMDELGAAEARRDKAADALAVAEAAAQGSDRAARTADAKASEAREGRAAATVRLEAAVERLAGAADQVRQTAKMEPEALAETIADEAKAALADPAGVDDRIAALERDRDRLGAVNLRAEEEATEHALRLDAMRAERADLSGAITRLRGAVEELNAEGRERLLAAFEVIHEGFKVLFQTLFEGGQAELKLVESDDPLEAGLEIYACPPGKRLAAMSLMSGGEQALTATALIFGVFLANPAPICVLDEVDAPLDDANVDRFCRMLDEMRRRTRTRFIAITHNPVTMSRMDRLFGVTMSERGVSQLVSVDLRQAEALVAAQ